MLANGCTGGRGGRDATQGHARERERERRHGLRGRGGADPTDSHPQKTQGRLATYH